MMNFFSKFPTVQYKQDNIRNIALRVSFLDRVRRNKNVIAPYKIDIGETPTQLAQDFYRDPGLFVWILDLNLIKDVFYGWPMGYRELQKYINKTYNNPQEIRFWRQEGNIFRTEEEAIRNGFTTPEAVTHETWESEQNEIKRNIFIIRPEAMQSVLAQFDEEMRRARENS